MAIYFFPPSVQCVPALKKEVFGDLNKAKLFFLSEYPTVINALKMLIGILKNCLSLKKLFSSAHSVVYKYP